MIRSLSFIQLFVVLAVGYLGGVLLCRSLPSADFSALVRLYDPRAAAPDGSPVFYQLLSVLSFYILAIGLSLSGKTRWLVMSIGAFKSVLFGLSSAYILANGVKMLAYAGWWFPFQLLATFLVCICCWTLAPPFFVRQPKQKTASLRLPLILAAAGLLVFLADKVVFRLVGG
ncbi:hypothetical protein NCCP2716_03980 [Sporosarcina sp. NCCP-2716]|uniref:hypothetical protein n=1 Tax=Sporosarcina sp. NCCP-2716 TaxID=2943679 RepID=UPI00203C11C0|nr:hypothetical protein [Sporosarcina sp. NCCP-2716]GKV67900.1 hypothetical protein NCCP2716_03980 [Sporosarcina sp. NCCP-2716]